MLKTNYFAITLGSTTKVMLL